MLRPTIILLLSLLKFNYAWGEPSAPNVVNEKVFHQEEEHEKPLPPVNTASELQARMNAGPTPLDAFTAYGKREFLKNLRWSDKGTGLGGMSTLAVRLELDAQQIITLFNFFNSTQYGEAIVRNLPDAPPLRFADPSPELEKDRNTLFQFYNDQRELAFRYEEETNLDTKALFLQYKSVFAKRMKKKNLKKAQLSDLPLLFEVANNVSSWTLNAQALSDLQAVFNEMESRGLDTRRVFNESMIAQLEASRQFDEAREFLIHHPGSKIHQIPKVIDSIGKNLGGQSVFDFDPLTNTLTRRAIENVFGTRLVMVVSPSCHFSREALQEISSNPDFFARIEKVNLLIITPPDESPSLSFIADWNSKHPKMLISTPYNREEWKEIDLPSVPKFHIFRSGRLHQTISGWNKNTTMETLLISLKE